MRALKHFAIWSPIFVWVVLLAQTVKFGPYGALPINITDNISKESKSGSITLVPGNMIGILSTDPSSKNTTYTTPSATVLCSLFPFLASGNVINWSYDWWVKNFEVTHSSIIAGGSGVSLVGTGTVLPACVRHFKVNFRSCSIPAVELISVETSLY